MSLGHIFIADISVRIYAVLNFVDLKGYLTSFILFFFIIYAVVLDRGGDRESERGGVGFKNWRGLKCFLSVIQNTTRIVTVALLIYISLLHFVKWRKWPIMVISHDQIPNINIGTDAMSRLEKITLQMDDFLIFLPRNGRFTFEFVFQFNFF